MIALVAALAGSAVACRQEHGRKTTSRERRPAAGARRFADRPDVNEATLGQVPNAATAGSAATAAAVDGAEVIRRTVVQANSPDPDAGHRRSVRDHAQLQRRGRHDGLSRGPHHRARLLLPQRLSGGFGRDPGEVGICADWHDPDGRLPSFAPPGQTDLRALARRRLSARGVSSASSSTGPPARAPCWRARARPELRGAPARRRSGSRPGSSAASPPRATQRTTPSSSISTSERFGVPHCSR